LSLLGFIYTSDECVKELPSCLSNVPVQKLKNYTRHRDWF